MNRKLFVTSPDTNAPTNCYAVYHFIDTSTGLMTHFSFVFFTMTGAMNEADVKSQIMASANAYATLNGITITDTKWWTDDLATVAKTGDYNDLINLPAIPSIITKKKFFKASVAGGAGDVVFYTDTNGDGTGTALYSGLTADDLSCFIDGVSDQYAFPTITVAGNKKSVTVNVKRQNFTTGNVLLNLLGALVTALTGVTYVNAVNGIAVKMIIGIDD